MKGFSISQILLVISSALWPLLAHAAPPKQILKLPFTIKKPGAYQLSKNLTFSGTGNAIQVEADDVTIDMKGYTITFDGTITADQQPAGIYALDQKNITIRNGVIQDFHRGIFLDSGNVIFAAGGHLVENIRADRCHSAGIEVEGRGSMLRNNWISNVRRVMSGTANTYGMRVSGSGLTIQSNRINDVYVPLGNNANVAHGITVDTGDSCRVVDNQISNTSLSVNISSVGLVMTNCAYAIVAGNHIIRSAAGIQFVDSDDLRYRDNTVTGALQAYFNDGTADAGTGNLP
ncbi:MAG TPA: NosD domain-containing protein, partial [Chthoniobacteraceae bacterium]|nr:NosD domain-containing protein [Chthoniobacteraceae bacterium]